MIADPPTAVPAESYVLPASYGQVRLWLLDQAQLGGPVYNTVNPLRIRGALDTARLRRALHTVVERHEVLRSVLRLQGADVVAVVHTRLDVPLDERDLAGRGGVDAIEEEIRRVAARPFDLAIGPLVRCHLLRVAADDHVLVVVIHHAIGDPRSSEILVGELAAGYAADADGADPRLPELPIQYPDFAAWQRQAADAGAFDDALDRWRQRLAGVRPTELPAELPPPDRRTARAVTAPVVVPADVLRRLRGLAGGVTPFMVAMAAYAALLGRWSGRDEVVVALPADGRDQPELRHVVGYFINTLPVRVDLSGDPTFGELLGRVRAACLAAYADAAVPFERIVEAAAPGRDVGRMPLAQAWLVVREPVALPRPAGLELTPVRIPPAYLPFDVALSLTHDEGALSGDLAAAADLITPATVRQAARRLAEMLAAVAGAPETRLSQLPLLQPAVPPAQPIGDPWPVPPGEPADEPGGDDSAAVEQLLRRLWTEILEVDNVAADDEFYASGGNSLRAVRLVMQAREAGLELPMDVVLGEHTLRQLADAATGTGGR
ncbi:condensation domain-containing protein [Micromonospora sp. NPDC048999]|uniref:condensation domain-containing protein n=1 Tax=Micromonospora sp. NPDC048999 TaxID=3155391 RepID=UPI0033E83479